MDSTKCNLQLFYKMDAESNESIVEQKILGLFDNSTKYYPYTQKDLVKNGQLIDKDLQL